MSNFEEIDVFREGEVVCVVTENRRTGARTFMIGKEFARDGELVRSSFLSPRHVDDARRILSKIEEYL